MATISLTLSDKYPDHTKIHTTSTGMRIALVIVFQCRAQLNDLNKRRKLYPACIKEGKRALAYTHHVCQLYFDVTSMDATVNNADIAMTLLCEVCIIVCPLNDYH